MHGGAKGTGRPITSGKRSAFGQIFGAGYEERLKAADLLDVRRALAILQSRILEKRQALGSDPPSAAWVRAQKAYGQLATAITSQDAGALRTSLQSLGEALSEGTSQASTWDEIVDLTCKDAAIVTRHHETELKRQQVISQDDFAKGLVQALSLFSEALVARLRIELADKAEAERISLLARSDMARLYEQKMLPMHSRPVASEPDAGE